MKISKLFLSILYVVFIVTILNITTYTISPEHYSYFHTKNYELFKSSEEIGFYVFLCVLKSIINSAILLLSFIIPLFWLIFTDRKYIKIY